MKEEAIVGLITNWLEYKQRFFANIHGTEFSKNGTPDFLTSDKQGLFVGIEAKVPKRTPTVNQWRKGVEMIKSGNRYIVAYDDFDLETLDKHQLPVIEFDVNKPLVEYDLYDNVKGLNKTTELIKKPY